MMIILIILIITAFTFLCGLSNSVQDKVDFHYYESIFRKWRWFDPKRSWLNKWKTTKEERAGELPIINEKSPWYYLGLHTPLYVERFPFSSTVLVFLTDAWHLFKWISFTTLELMCVGLFLFHFKTDYFWILTIVGVLYLKTIRGIGFTLGFDKWWKAK